MRPAFVFRLFPLVCAVIALNGCVSYAPAPLDPARLLQQRAALRVNESAVRGEITRLAPSAHWDGEHWDRLSLLAAALTYNPDIAEARAALAAAESEAKAARIAPGFNVTLTAEYAFNPPESSPWLFGIASDLPLDTGPRREARVSIADLNTRIALFDYLDTAWSVRLRIRRALAEYLLAQEQTGLAQELKTLHQRQMDAMEHRLAAGAASRSDLERVRLSAAADLQRLSETQARAAAAALQIAAAAGISVSALNTSELTWPGVDAPPTLPDPLPQACLDEALLARPDIARSSRRYDQAEQALRAAVAAQYPALHIGPGYTWERTLSKLPFALGLSFPSLDLNRAAIGAAEARREEAGRALEAVVAAARNAVEAAQSDYHAAWVQLRRSREQHEIAQRLAAQADSAIGAGAIGRIEWSSAQSGKLTTMLDEFNAVSHVRAAEATLEDALRRPLEGPELAITAAPLSSEDSTCTLPAPLQP